MMGRQEEDEVILRKVKLITEHKAGEDREMQVEVYRSKLKN